MIEVLKQMVEALKSATVDCSNFHHAKKDQNHNLGECPPVIRWHHAIEAGKQAIAELESQEPVAHCTVRPLRGDEAYPKTEILWVKGRPIAGPLYIHPPQRTEQLKACVYCGQLVAKEKNT